MQKVRLLVAGCVAGVSILTASFAGQERTITIHVGTLLDGRGGTQRNTNIVVQGSKILKLDPSVTNPTYDLRTLTVLPGMIPRILTSVRQINENSGGPEQLRQFVRQLKTDHADVRYNSGRSSR